MYHECPLHMLLVKEGFPCKQKYASFTGIFGSWMKTVQQFNKKKIVNVNIPFPPPPALLTLLQFSLSLANLISYGCGSLLLLYLIL